MKVLDSLRVALRLAVGLIFMILLASGCSKKAADQDREDEEHPVLKKAHDVWEAGQHERARALYLKALEDDSSLARAHMHLAVLNDEHFQDYVLAIYHYRKYLELRPDTDKKELLQDAIKTAEANFASQLPMHPSTSRRMEDLRAENAELRSRLQQLVTAVNQSRGQVPPRAKAPPLSPTPTRPPAQVPPPASNPPRTANETAPAAPLGPTMYKVVAGDNLSRISEKVYGSNSRWKDIFEANKELLKRPDRLKVDQQLIIPR